MFGQFFLILFLLFVVAVCFFLKKYFGVFLLFRGKLQGDAH
jgi:hypothetical protein